MMMTKESKKREAGTGFASFFLAMIMAICTWGQDTQASTECPDIGFNYGYIDYDNRGMMVTRGQGLGCCLHHLQVLVVYDGLEPGDAFNVHGVFFSNDTDETVSGNMVTDLYATGNERISAYFDFVSPKSSVFIAAWEMSSELEGSCLGLDYSYSAYGCNDSTDIALSNGSVELKLRFGIESALDKADPKRGLLWMHHEQPSPLLTSPKSLVYSKAKDTAIDVVRDEEHTIRQIRAEDGLLKIVPIDAFGYEIQLYTDQNVAGWNGERYETSAPAHYTWKIYNPDRDPTNQRLRIEEHTQALAVSMQFIRRCHRFTQI